MSNRFDSIDYLRDFQAGGRFPAVHDELFGLVMECTSQTRVLDLCCSAGLLGERLRRTGEFETVIGVDCDRRAIEAARRHGVAIPITELLIQIDTLPRLESLIRRHAISAVVARRCLPELLGDHPDMDSRFAGTLVGAGVAELFIEGRMVVPRATNRLRSIDREIEAVSSRFVPVVRRRACCLLRAKAVRPETASSDPCGAPS